MQEALKLGDRLCIMKDGEIVQIGTPQQLLQNPVNDFVQQFIGGKQSDQLFTIHDVLQPITVTNDFGHTIPVDAPFPTILEKLAEHDVLGVEENGKLIGMVTRASTLRYLARILRKEGMYMVANVVDVFQERKAQSLVALLEHIQISFIALFFAVLIAIPLGIYLTNKKKIAESIIGISAVSANDSFLSVARLINPFIRYWESSRNYCVSRLCAVAYSTKHLHGHQ